MINRTSRLDQQVALFAFLLSLAVSLPLGGFLLAHQIRDFRARSGESLRSTASVVAANASAAVAFNNAADATEILDSLRNVRAIRAAALYHADGTIFAVYHNVPIRVADVPPPDGFEHVLIEVRYRGEVLGTLYIQSDLPRELRATVGVWIAVYSGGVILALVLARLLALRFRRTAADPLRAVAQTAGLVTEHRDFTARAEPRGPAEVVALANALNEMLAELARRDDEIARKNETLRSQLERVQAEVREREKAEQQLRDTHREMVRLSREAGMAEVASGLLHNIGNVVNSVNVGIELLSDALRQDPRTAIGALHVLLNHPNPAVAEVFTAHPKGPELRQALQELVRRTHSQLATSEAEVLSLRGKLGHLKDTITRQQSLAKSRLVTEPFDLREAVKEALLLCDDTLRNQKIVVEQSSQGPTQIIADRSHVIQILVNLLRNAQTAITQVHPAQGRIEIRLGTVENGNRFAAVTDNGIGISADRLTRIFSFGFTTKADGHGFGLHSSANSARAMGGRLHVTSPGPGLGATFTLELPFYHLPSTHGSAEQTDPDRR